jgi:Cu/Ag efflux protein CusF
MTRRVVDLGIPPAAHLLALVACSAPAPPVPAGARAYAARGEVVQAPSPVTAGIQMLVRHEAIDDFVDASGKTVGMDAMVMPFEAAASAAAKDLAAGDKVEVRFSMDWQEPRLRVERIQRLPPGTALEFRAAGAARK